MMRNVENTEVLGRDAWRDALADVTRRHQGDGVTIEVLGRDFGDQLEATEHLPLTYIDYDPKDDVVIVAVGGQTARFPVVLRHMIEHPNRVFISPPRGTPTESVGITDGEGTETIVTLRPRPALPKL